MTIDTLNTLLREMTANPGREGVFRFAFSLLDWMGLEVVPDQKPRLVSPSTQKLKEMLAPVPLTVQPQLYRLTADGQSIRVRFATLKKLKKEAINQLVVNDPGMATFQAASRGIINLPGRPPYIPTEPYYIHLVTTPAYDSLLFILNQDNQKRILTFRNRLSNTQYFKIVEQWKAIAGKPKPEIACQLWQSLDIREVNREFYRKIKERYDNLVFILKQQTDNHDNISDNPYKQFAVRLIGRYIFCWFLKEKGIIPERLLITETIRSCQGKFYQQYLTRLFFDTLNTEVQHRSFLPDDNPLSDLYAFVPYLNGGLFEEHPEDVPFHQLPLDDWLASFVDVLESFDFTVDESSSQYQQVAIDPEMLGRIFENLMASQNPETEKISN